MKSILRVAGFSGFWPIVSAVLITNLLIGVAKEHSFDNRQRLALIDEVVRTCDIVSYDQTQEIAEYACHDDRPSIRIKVTVPELAVALDKWKRNVRS